MTMGDENTTTLTMAAEFGQLLVRENQKLKDRNQELIKELSNESMERRSMENAKRKMEEKLHMRLKEALEQLVVMEKDNMELEKHVRELEQLRSFRKVVQGDQRVECDNRIGRTDPQWMGEEETKADCFDTSDAASSPSSEHQFWIQRCKELQSKLKASNQELSKTQDDLDEEREINSALEQELREKKQMISAAKREASILKQKLEQGKQQLAERAQLERFVEKLTRQNMEQRDELEEALILLEHTKEALRIQSECVGTTHPLDHIHDSNNDNNESKTLVEELTDMKVQSKKERALSSLLGLSGSTKPTFFQVEAVKEEPVVASTKFDQDPMFFHFHMLVQTTRIKMESILGFGHEIGTQDLSVTALYKQAVQENVPFFEFQAFVEDAYRRVAEHRFAADSPVVREANKLLRDGLISMEEFDHIVEADKELREHK